MLVPPRDPGRFAEAILGRLVDPAGTKGMGESGRKRAGEHFSVDRMVRETEALYESLAGTGG
ncbi:MAG TPA: hypothetical protein DD658_01095 [Deltaproteobacteria bacterium]|nr:hypothetical protein [Deltaproteobacteria bacterium]